MQRTISLGWGRVALGCAVIGCWLPREAGALIFYSTGDPSHNTAAPTGDLANSGWQWTGFWGDVTGTTISPNQFITATHVGGSVGQSFTVGGVSYTTTDVVNNGDLAIWTVSGTFSSYAPITSTAPSIGTDAVILGRGTQRGADVSQNGELKGWQWGAADGALRWGENTVESNGGTLIKFNFDATGGANEAHLSTGDSGGGVFVNDGGVWKLTAINYGVDGPFSTTLGGSQFNAAIFDKGGLYKSSAFYTESANDKPSAFYSTSLAASYSWISSVMAVQVPEPSATTLVGIPGALFLGMKLARRRN
jgi:hypothetical protein